MPDKVKEWINKLENAEERIFNIFSDILFNTESDLSNKDFNIFCKSLINDIKKAYNSFKKWLEC